MTNIMSTNLGFFSPPLIGEKINKEKKRLLPKQQIKIHESLVLKENKLVIVDEAPSSFEDDLIGMMISISFK